MHTTFMIDGGAGRLITAIPALEKYAIKNPDDDFRVLTAAWEEIYNNHPVLQNRTFNINQKGMFDLHIKNRRMVVPEPYHLHEYYNQKKHLTQAFDQEINQTQDHSDLDKPNLYLSQKEVFAAQSILNQIRQQKKKDRVIVIQPYGSGISIQNGRPIDNSNRSLDVDFALKLIYELSKDNVVIFFGQKEFYHPGDNYSVNFFDNGADIRLYMTMIHLCDYFVGVDSLGQHMARSMNKPGTVIMGSTFEDNVSYKDHFTIYRNSFEPVYSPIRISNIDCSYAENLNERTMQFTEEDLQNIVELANGKKL
jgi:ADP-heptose:LPS heptosyltransferase